MKKLFLSLIVSVVFSIVTGCAEPGALSSLKENDTLKLSSIRTTSETITASSEQSKQVNTSSITQSSNNTSSTLSSPPIISSGVSSEFLTQSELSQNTEDDKMNNNCTLIVNGRDITQECYVNFNQIRNLFELPLTAIAKELGAKVEWQGDVATITICGEKCVIDTTEHDFGFWQLPGSEYHLRKVVDGNIILDDATALRLIKLWFDAEVKINLNEKIVEIQANTTVSSTSLENQ